MKQIKHLNYSENTMKVDKSSEEYRQGVAQRLLDKYSPSKKFTIIGRKSLEGNEPKAA